ncbi:MAG: Smr/MutS family protein [Vicinamibacteria bacterium]
MGVSIGDRVHVPGLSTGVILEVRNHGRCLVEIKGRGVEVLAAQLEPVSPKRVSIPSREDGKRVSAPAREGGTSAGDVAVAPDRRGHAPMSLDLHGMTVDQAVEALDVFLNDALLAGHAEVRVIHGRSGGRVKAAAHARLRALSVVRAFRVDERNAGVTVVML